ncbi:hypothetical protein [Mesorhizobium sp. ES1-4]|uniref:hypothetical protein n=1 Tax=Mesorhizobium sp. ES1-4 TaxID=2876627 RepID=UPI001CD00D94|nr:hypothetical protein [Mesorhizobium sp. ES1-4]MBZ9800097.1 hypothetical protein [Mesorhizobium sp. ES1-4]
MRVDWLNRHDVSVRPQEDVANAVEYLKGVHVACDIHFKESLRRGCGHHPSVQSRFHVIAWHDHSNHEIGLGGEMKRLCD